MNTFKVQRSNNSASSGSFMGSAAGKTSRIARTPVERLSISHCPCKKRMNLALRVITSASYGASGYGPVGGDARIKVIGVGGGGGNAVNRMISSGLQVSTSRFGEIV